MEDRRGFSVKRGEGVCAKGRRVEGRSNPAVGHEER